VPEGLLRELGVFLYSVDGFGWVQVFGQVGKDEADRAATDDWGVDGVMAAAALLKGIS
jgi:hypothetical protein